MSGDTERIRELEQQVIQSATAATLAQLDVRNAERQTEAFAKDASKYWELKGWIRLCDDNPQGHAEFYQWASHYFFGTPPPEDTP